MKDYAGAVDQYIELINNFPEDAGLVTEAALYSLRYQRQQQLMDFYGKTDSSIPARLSLADGVGADPNQPRTISRCDRELRQGDCGSARPG